MEKSLNKTRLLVFNALFIALILVMQLTGIGLIRLGVINITFYCTVIAVGTLVLGLKSGLIQSLVFASISFYMALTSPSGLVAPILSRSWLPVFLMSYIPRLCVPLVITMTYRLLKKFKKKEGWALAVSGALGSLTNTVLYLGIMMLCYVPMFAEYPAVPFTIGGVVLYGGLPECLAAGIIVPPLALALRKIKR